jgi:hypothetical protein
MNLDKQVVKVHNICAQTWFTNIFACHDLMGLVGYRHTLRFVARDGSGDGDGWKIRCSGIPDVQSLNFKPEMGGFSP